MNTAHFALECRTVMPLAIRLLTLFTFTAHAVLGCCVSHGSCMREQAGTRVNACCDSAIHSNCDDEHDHHGERKSEVGGQLVSPSYMVCLDEQTTNHENHRHCDDLQCVFGVSHDASTLSSVSGDLVLWCGRLEESQSLPRQCHGSRDPYSDRLPQSLCNRAILQVWLI